MIKKATAMWCGIAMVILSSFGFYEWPASLLSSPVVIDRDWVMGAIGLTLIIIGVCK